MSTVYGFNNKEDVARVLRMLAKSEGGGSRSVVSPSSVRQEARYAKILTVLNNSGNAEHDNKEATGVEAIWDKDNFEFKIVDTNPVSYDDEGLKDSAATVYSTNNITSKTAMKVDDIVLLQQYPHLSDTSGWLVVETGGGTDHGLCTITAEGATDKQFLVDVVVGNPNDGADPVKGILYLNYATTNPVSIGAQIQTVVYPSSVSEIDLDCFPAETLYNLVALPEVP